MLTQFGDPLFLLLMQTDRRTLTLLKEFDFVPVFVLLPRQAFGERRRFIPERLLPG